MNAYEKYIGRTFGDRYRIERLIGIGGMAAVYEAYDEKEDRTVAIKLLKDEITNDVQSVKRFINESKAVSMMNHPNIVRIYDVAVSDELKYIVMDRVEGITLKKYMNVKKALSFNVTMSVAEQVLSALVHAHKQGVIHRDIKPQNIMLLRNGKVVVTDFGIAKLPEAENVTMADKAIGTVYYISPEQASGKPIDARSDLYSLGAMMYEMITGKLPFTADSPVSVALKQVNEDPVPPSEILPSVPKGLEQIILCAMRKRPERRFQSAEQMLEYVRKVKDDPFAVLKMPGDQDEYSEVSDGKKKKFALSRFIRPASYHKETASWLPTILGVCFAFLIVALIAGYYVVDQLFLNSSLNFFRSSSTEEITVEDYLFASYNEVLKTQLEADGFQVDVQYEYSNDYEADVILKQSPEAGSIRKKNKFKLQLTVSLGKKMEQMPNYTAKDYREAKIELLRKGYSVTVEKISNDAIEAGCVIRTVPMAGENMVAGQEITLVVSLGAEIKYTKMPNLVGKTSSDAARTILASNLRKGNVTYEYSDVYPKDTVMDQETPASTSVPQGYSVNLTVSRGPKPQS